MTHMRHQRAALTALLALGASACIVPGPTTTETREVDPFDELELSGGFDRVTIERCDDCTPRLELRAGERVLEELDVGVDGQTLRVDIVGGWRGTVDFEMTVHTPTLEGIKLDGAARIIAGELEAGRFDLDCSGSCDATFGGEVDALYVRSSGDMNLEAFDLTAARVFIDLDGAGSLEVCATDLLDVESDGSATVIYDCAPDEIKQDLDGEGELRSR